MIWTLKIKLHYGAYAEGKWETSIEISPTSTLGELHLAIQKALEFDDDHMYEFFVGRTERSRDRIHYDFDDDVVFNKTIASLFPLDKGRKLFYLFDYGDNWLFQISKVRYKEFPAKKGVRYPRSYDEIGQKPVQYPDLEDCDEDDEEND